MALAAAAPLYRGAPEAREAKEAGILAYRAFMREALPKAADETCVLASRPDHNDPQLVWESSFRKPLGRRRRSKLTQTP